jgi:antitoxin component of MazEF toxin-antitoxin module
MIKQLQKIGNSRGVVLDRALLKLLKIEDDDLIELVPRPDGLLLRKADEHAAYEIVTRRHRTSFDKLRRKRATRRNFRSGTGADLRKR